MNCFWKAAKTGVLLATVGALFAVPRASAQAQTPAPTTMNSPDPNETSTNDGWHVGITPYIWFAGIHGTSGVLGHDASVHADFSDIFNYLNIGAMGVLDLRYNRVIMPVDFLWMKLSDNQGLPVNEIGLNSIKAQMTETILSPKIGYRIADGKRVKVDALFGIRYWHLSTTFTLQPQIANGYSQSASWTDAVAGGRIEFALTPKATATIFGDAGGGSARLDYQVGGALGYKVSRRWVVLVGYRYLNVDYRPNGKALFVYDVAMPGVAVGVTFTIK